ncbi:hypothetical protein [Campylobacter lari]|uniref:hypothetical protein n=1 Tax=Campylobacter lari TaxID=201 RepID=UPI0012724C2A|nr:hypothetical protein [Campylobacter lari]EAH7585601.1 hypothetical protein [Campylobacter lari]EAJ5709520.1 hypothetical protein [Campylobacter lari]EAK0493990.1 hypothetical protein [Campylobacter lari]EAK2602288.1 hypothetical protein [Campylobacter lari]EGK7475998.1 hypothetical protein [Campylobacter lari]
MENEQNKDAKHYYRKYVEEANDRIKSNQEAQDKMILTLSASLFGLLSIFLKEIPYSCFSVLIIICLSILNFITLLSTLFSFYFCKKGNEKDINYAYEYYINQKEEFYDKKSFLGKIGDICNGVSLISFGLVLFAYAILIVYYFINKN